MVVVVCGDEYNKGDLHSGEVEQEFNQYVKPILGDKAILFSWNASHDTIHEDYMLQILQPGAFQNQSTGSQKTGAIGSAEAFTSATAEHSPAMDQSSRYSSKGHSQGTARATYESDEYRSQGNIPQGRETGQTVTVLKTRLRYGQISFEKKDLEIMEEGLEIPVWLLEHLQMTKRNVKEALLEIHRDASGNLNPVVTEGVSTFEKINTPERAHYHPLSETTNQSSHQIPGNVYHQDRGERGDGARSKQHDTRYPPGPGQSHQTPAEYNVQNNRGQRGNGAMYQQRHTRQQPVQYSTPPGYSYQGNIPQGRGTGQVVTVLKTRLRYGRISYEKKDLEIMEEGLEIPVWLVEHLQTTKSNVKVALLEIHRDASGNLNPTVTEDMSWYQKAKSYAGM